MQKNQGFTMQIKNNSGNYISLYPKTTKHQVMGWNIGKISGPYIVELKANKWINNEQIVNLDGISPDKKIYCLKILSGTKDQMKQQSENYNLLLFNGVISLNNQIKFKSSDIIDSDIKVQVWWTE